MSIYTTTPDRKPYVYIIQHKDTGLKYVGAKWATDANPDNFMQQYGYQTSSKTIKDILDSTPGVVFSILEVIEESELQTPFGCQTVHEYESWYMTENNCRESSDWYNKMPPWMSDTSSPEFEKMMMEKYGVTNCSELPWVRRKAENTLFERTGYYYTTKDPETMKKIVVTNLEKLGVEYPMMSEQVKDKSKETCMLKYGIPHAMTEKNITKVKNTKLERYGDENYCNTEKISETINLRLGVDWAMQSPVTKENLKISIQKKYGEEYTNVFQLPEIIKIIQEKGKVTVLNKYGVDNVSKLKYYCQQCNKDGVGLGNLKRWHGTHTGLFLFIHDVKVEYTDGN